jgi:deoxyribodipyrimidine photolyase-related protein
VSIYSQRRKIVWVLGDQLYYWSPFWPDVQNDVTVVLWENPEFVSRFTYHTQKLQLVFGAMREFAKWLEEIGWNVEYLPIHDERVQIGVDARLDRWWADGYRQITMWQPATHENGLFGKIREKGFELEIRGEQNFFSPSESIAKHIIEKDSYYFQSFYEDVRRELGILEYDGKPTGGKWSFDKENRKKLPKKIDIPKARYVMSESENETLRQVREDIEKAGLKNHGQGELWLPISHTGAKQWMYQFIEERLHSFGTYEDAISRKEDIVFHSVISPYLNLGVIHPEELVVRIIDAYESEDIELNNIEGFVRQVIGWREYIKAMYDKIGEDQKKQNFFGFERKLSQAWYDGTTGLAPVDHVIKTVNEKGYAHHIERLMVMGNAMLLCEIDPDEVYRWFMEMFVDAYEWVMVPNVYGMSQFADGGVMMTKPYISGSNYILKMSDWKKDGEWDVIWDALYWDFIGSHKETFLANHRMSMMPRMYEKKSEEQKKNYREIKEKFLERLG